MGFSLAVIGVVLALACSRKKSEPATMNHLVLPALPNVEPRKPNLELAPLTDTLRAKGFNECNPHDPLGLGPYSPFVRLPIGRMLIPQKGGHTPDLGYDVLVHFHGADPVRRLLVQVTRGLVLVLIDKGVGGGPYSRALASKQVFPILRRGIESALKRHSNNEAAHIRHLAVSSWSAGYAAVSKILQQEVPDIDAYVILDGLHGAWKQGARRAAEIKSLDARFIEREIELARRAQQGESTFVLTYSDVEPYTYPSTRTTAALLVHELGLKQKRRDPGKDPFGQIAELDERGLHVWGYRGGDKMGHCAQLWTMPKIATEYLERVWKTPAMDRNVEPQPLYPWKR
jgi:hypothetical protein